MPWGLGHLVVHPAIELEREKVTIFIVIQQACFLLGVTNCNSGIMGPLERQTIQYQAPPDNASTSQMPDVTAATAQWRDRIHDSGVQYFLTPLVDPRPSEAGWLAAN
jgi:hypothetical protein